MEKKIKLSELLYYVFFLSLFTSRILGLVEGNTIYSTVLLFSLICFGISYLMVSEMLIVHIIDIFLLGISVISYLKSGEKGIILFFAMMIGARFISIERLFKVVLLIAGSSYAIMLMLGVFGWIPEAEVIMLSSSLGDITRRSISNLQVNVVMTPYLVFMLMAIYLYRNADRKVVVKVYALLLCGLLYIFSYCFAKTALIAGLLIIIVSYYYRFECRFKVFSKVATYCIYLICMIVGLMAPKLFDITGIKSVSDLFEKFPHFQSWYHRLYIGKYYLINNDISPLGQRLYDPDPDAIFYPLIHQAQLYLLLQYGLILFAIVNLLHFITINYYLKKREGVVLATILSYAFIGILEPLLFNLSFKNISFVFVGVAYAELIRRLAIKRRSVTVPALLKDREIKLRLPNVIHFVRGIVLITRKDSQKMHLFSVAGGVTFSLAVAFISISNLNCGELLLIDYIRLIVSSLIWGTVIIGTMYTFVLYVINRSKKD